MQTNKPTNQTKSNNSKNKTKQTNKKTLLPIYILLIETLAESAMMLS